MAYTFKHGDRPLDGYTVQRAVGRGGFGEVYYAISDGGREVALKYLRDNPQIELRGVSHCINLKSPHLVSIFDVKKADDGEYVIIMEYCSGPSLRDLLIAEPNGFGPQKAAFFVREIAKGLSYLHDRGIVHRDLKPGNIFYDDGYVKIGDYGLSKFISVSRHSAQTASVGTVHYMAPEIGSGNYSRGVDIYALGVMLYEMLCGKVPFEGSTMAEVLMKHLTAQPTLDAMPHPFGDVVRKALEKDPANRYQTTDEMIDDLLGVDAVRQSLAGFSTQSLQGAVRRAEPHGAESPLPSPNPMPRLDAGQPPFAQPVGPLPPPLNRRMQRVSRKFERRMARLAKRQGRAPGSPPPPPGATPASPGASADTHRRRRIALGLLLAVGMAVGLGVISGNAINSEDVGASAGMLVVALAGGVGLSRKAIPWFGADHGPSWTRRMIQLGCCGPLLAIGAAPILDSGRYSDAGLGVFLALLVMSVFADWDKDLDRATAGEMSLGTAIWTGFGAMIVAAVATGITNGEPTGKFMFMTAGIAGLASLILQASSWWIHGPAPAVDAAHGGFRGALDRMHRAASSSPHDHRMPSDDEDSQTRRWPGESDDPHHSPDPSMGGLAPTVPTRWMVTRGFWSIVAFVLMGGAIVTFLFAVISESLGYHEQTAVIIGCTGFSAFMVFALSKTTARKREGFWRDTLRPFLISLTLFGIGAAITAIAREWHHATEASGRCLPDEGRVGILAGLILASMLLLAVVLFTGRRRRPRRDAFLVGAAPSEPAARSNEVQAVSTDSSPI